MFRYLPTRIPFAREMYKNGSPSVKARNEELRLRRALVNRPRDNSRSGFTFRLATQRELEQVLCLRRRVYLDTFGSDGVDELDSVAHHLVALLPNGRMVAALRVVGPMHRPFDLEHFVDLPQMDPGRRPAEVGRLCVRKDFRRIKKDQFVHLGLFRLLLNFATENGITDLFTLGLPVLRGIYRLVLFRDTGIACYHPLADQDLHLMHLDIGDLRERGKSGHSIARLLSESANETHRPE